MLKRFGVAVANLQQKILLIVEDEAGIWNKRYPNHRYYLHDAEEYRSRHHLRVPEYFALLTIATTRPKHIEESIELSGSLIRRIPELEAMILTGRPIEEEPRQGPEPLPDTPLHCSIGEVLVWWHTQIKHNLEQRPFGYDRIHDTDRIEAVVNRAR